MKNFLLAARPKTLVVSVAPPLVSYFYATKYFQEVPIYLVLCAIFSALLIQLATNFFNDLIDHQKGSDVVRIGPQRVTSSGLVSEKTIKIWAYGALAGSVALAIPLIIRGGPIIFTLGIISLYLSYGYTGGIISLAYRGLGELFVFLFFGLFSFLGSLYIYSLELNFQSLVIASQFGLLATTFICINNLRDRDEDKKVSKLTLATRMSVTSYRILIIVTILLPYILNFTISHYGGLVSAGLLIGLPFCAVVLKKNGSDLNVGLKIAGIHLIIFSILSILDIQNGSIL